MLFEWRTRRKHCHPGLAGLCSSALCELAGPLFMHVLRGNCVCGGEGGAFASLSRRLSLDHRLRIREVLGGAHQSQQPYLPIRLQQR